MSKTLLDLGSTFEGFDVQSDPDEDGLMVTVWSSSGAYDYVLTRDDVAELVEVCVDWLNR